jgi:hypothetical protein
MADLMTGAASDLLEGLSTYGGGKSPYAEYAQQASSYLDSYGNKHEVPGAHGPANPSAGESQDLCSVYNLSFAVFFLGVISMETLLWLL